MYIWYVCLRYYGQVPKIRTSPNPCNSIFNSKKMQGFGGTFHPANLQMLSLQNMVHLYPSVAKLISPAVMPSHVYIGSELSWCFGNSWSSRTSTWKQIQPNHTDQTTEIICKYPFLQKSSRTSNVSYSRFFCRKPNQHNQPTTLLICPLHACDFSDAVLCISCAVGSFGSIVMASNQSQNLRTHTHTKVKQTENNGGRWMILMMSCVVLWHQIGHDLTCHARSTQYNWATSCIKLPNLWENIVSCLSISLRAVRECLFAQVPVLICESHLDESQLHSRDTLPVAPDRWRIKWNLFAWGNFVLWSFWISVCMDHIFKLSRPTRSPSFKGSGRQTGCHCRRCRMQSYRL